MIQRWNPYSISSNIKLWVQDWGEEKIHKKVYDMVSVMLWCYLKFSKVISPANQILWSVDKFRNWRGRNLSPLCRRSRSRSLEKNFLQFLVSQIWNRSTFGEFDILSFSKPLSYTSRLFQSFVDITRWFVNVMLSKLTSDTNVEDVCSLWSSERHIWPLASTSWHVTELQGT